MRVRAYQPAPAGFVLAGALPAAWVGSLALGRLVDAPRALAGLLVISAAVGWVATPAVAALAGGIVWIFGLGFVESSLGVLTWHPGDGSRLVALCSAGMVAALAHRALAARVVHMSMASVHIPAPRRPQD